MTKYLNGDGNTTDYQYDGDGRVVEQSANPIRVCTLSIGSATCERGVRSRNCRG
jgi:YD repeat-containing protein